MNLFDLTGRAALVTGAGGYLGREIARALAGAGAVVWLNGRDVTKLEQLAADLKDGGFDGRPLPFDVTDAGAVAAGLRVVEAESGRLDVLVNNAHIGRSGSFTSASRELFAEASALAVG